MASRRLASTTQPSSRAKAPQAMTKTRPPCRFDSAGLFAPGGPEAAEAPISPRLAPCSRAMPPVIPPPRCRGGRQAAARRAFTSRVAVSEAMAASRQ